MDQAVLQTVLIDLVAAVQILLLIVETGIGPQVLALRDLQHRRAFESQQPDQGPPAPRALGPGSAWRPARRRRRAALDRSLGHALVSCLPWGALRGGGQYISPSAQSSSTAVPSLRPRAC